MNQPPCNSSKFIWCSLY